MENELIYLIGEALMMELEEIQDVTYPQTYDKDSLKIVTNCGKSYQLILKLLSASQT